MQKFIRISAISATALKVLSLTLLLISIPFQSLIAETFYGGYYAEALPIFPVVPFIQLLLSIGATLPLIFICGNKRGGIGAELVIFGCQMILLPLINTLITNLFAQVLMRQFGTDYYSAYNVTNAIFIYLAVPANWGTALAYAACGMSIVYKKLSK